MNFINSNFEEAPHLVFWETTKACPLACKHCRANAIDKPLPGELTTEEGKKLLKDISDFGKKVVVVFTGGDLLSRKDIFELITYARDLNLIPSVSPSPSERILGDTMKKLKQAGAIYASISLDGATPQTNDWLRGAGSYYYAIEGIKRGLEAGLKMQINTVVWKMSYPELPNIAKLIYDIGIRVWEVFFLIPIGRGTMELDIDREKYMDVIQFLVDVTKYGISVRTVEGPFFRRAKIERLKGIKYESPTYLELVSRLKQLMGEPKYVIDKSILPTRDGAGVLFVSYDGTVYPSGFLPLPLGSVKKKSIVDIYRNNEVLKAIRMGKLKGKCGKCEFVDICGGSRARAYAMTGDPFAEDPACPYLDKF